MADTLTTLKTRRSCRAYKHDGFLLSSEWMSALAIDKAVDRTTLKCHY